MGQGFVVCKAKTQKNLHLKIKVLFSPYFSNSYQCFIVYLDQINPAGILCDIMLWKYNFFLYSFFIRSLFHTFKHRNQWKEHCKVYTNLLKMISSELCELYSSFEAVLKDFDVFYLQIENDPKAMYKFISCFLSFFPF